MRLFAMIPVIGSLAVAGYAASQATPGAPALPPARTSPVASCAAAGCHGGDAGRARGEQSTWSAGDPHARAYRVLFNETSRRITANLRKADPARPAHASRDAACLVCHAPDPEAPADGVGCDSCHGPSKNWLPLHYEPTWAALGAPDRFALGFNETKNLVGRTKVCAACHVGDPGDVNHDLIAAGHPRLAFEYARFHYQPGYVKHWKETREDRDFEIRSWHIGQIVALQKACALRAQRGSRPGAEFSEASCFACHQTLKGVPAGGAKPPAPWQPWHTSLDRVLAEATPLLYPELKEPKLEKFRAFGRAMSETATPPSPDDLRALQKGADAELAAWLEQLDGSDRTVPNRVLTDADVRTLARAVATSAAAASADWDAFAPHYLALAAFLHAGGAALADVRGPVEELARLMKYGEGYNSPTDFRPAAVRAQFTTVADTLKPRAAR